MGKEINKSNFLKKDFENFRTKLAKETDILRKNLNSSHFSNSDLILGLELEGWLVDKNFYPIAKSDELIKKLNDKNIVHELMKFNFEINVKPIKLTKDNLDKLENELNELWHKCTQMAQKIGCIPVLIGMLPTARVKDFSVEQMSSLKRYKALNDQITKCRQNNQIEMSISGVEQHIDRFNNILLEASTTSLQIHLQLPIKQAVNYFNSAIYLSAASVGISTNSPYFFDCHLWEETRIPVFEQIVYMENEKDPTARRRTNFGNNYVKKSIMEFFERNLQSYSPILPVDLGKDYQNLEHLKLHNGTIWRWNRPIIGKSGNKLHIRLEHRPIPSGPTIKDIVANIAFFTGSMKAAVTKINQLKNEINFAQAKANFYNAARYGLDATFRHKDQISTLKSMINKHYLPMMQEGLDKLKVDQIIANHYLDIIEKRVASGQTGSKWQSEFIRKNGKNFTKMMHIYNKNQMIGNPVHTWKI